MAAPKQIPLTPCKSSGMCGTGYDLDTKTLAVQFKADGPLYHFAGVPEELYDEFRQAKSFGRFFAERIRGKFDTVKIEMESSEKDDAP